MVRQIEAEVWGWTKKSDHFFGWSEKKTPISEKILNEYQIMQKYNEQCHLKALLHYIYTLAIIKLVLFF